MVTKEKSDSPRDMVKFIKRIRNCATDMGYIVVPPKNGKLKNVVFRNNTETKNPEKIDKRAYFGYINPEEESSGTYYDFSLVFFPQRDLKHCVVGLVVGLNGFKNDLDLAILPWARRLFIKLIKTNKKDDFGFKNDFSNIEDGSSLKRFIKKINELGCNEIHDALTYYKKYIQACQLIYLDDKEWLEDIKGWLAQFAKLKEFKKENIESIQENCGEETLTLEKIKDILDSNRFVILQGAPGTGKTYNALKIADTYFSSDNVFFEQFHAETSYSDFVYGISPDLKSGALSYTSKRGILYRAMLKARSSKDKVLLIIDEINRANLSNVLGPVFYLFEKHHDKRNIPMHIGNDDFSELPENLYVIGTMNTADRSLAVVDFALRRRFTWITLRPKNLAKEDLSGYCFHEKEFTEFNELFEKYATDEELNLQPGQSYFITDNESSMYSRLRYELMPLMKEYFNEGYMEKAKDEFCDYFYKKIGVLMYE